MEFALLLHVLDEHPALLDKSDLIRELSGAAEDVAGRDAVERAISELVGRGLLKRLGECVLPTRAAAYIRILGGL
jgi:hypothetical protein